MNILGIIHWIFSLYTILLAIRIIASWFENIRSSQPLLLIAKVVDPYLNLFRKVIPPIGGMLDLSPILAFFGLQFLEYIVSLPFRGP